MQVISRRLHAALDYIIGTLLFFTPRLFDLDPTSPSARMFIALGCATLLYSAITQYELCVVELLPFRVHLILDVIQSAILITSPFLLHLPARLALPPVLIGLAVLAVVALTRTSTSTPPSEPPFAG